MSVTAVVDGSRRSSLEHGSLTDLQRERRASRERKDSDPTSRDVQQLTFPQSRPNPISIPPDFDVERARQAVYLHTVAAPYFSRPFVPPTSRRSPTETPEVGQLSQAASSTPRSSSVSPVIVHPDGQSPIRSILRASPNRISPPNPRSPGPRVTFSDQTEAPRSLPSPVALRPTATPEHSLEPLDIRSRPPTPERPVQQRPRSYSYSPTSLAEASQSQQLLAEREMQQEFSRYTPDQVERLRQSVYVQTFGRREIVNSPFGSTIEHRPRVHSVSHSRPPLERAASLQEGRPDPVTQRERDTAYVEHCMRLVYMNKVALPYLNRQ